MPSRIRIRCPKDIGLRRPYQRVDGVSTHEIRPHPMWRVLACHQVIHQSANLAASVREAPDIQTRNSMVTRPANAARPALGLSVSSLRRDEVELLLCLVQAKSDALLVEQPQIAADGCVHQA
jgi:hypothetical protein